MLLHFFTAVFRVSVCSKSTAQGSGWKPWSQLGFLSLTPNFKCISKSRQLYLQRVCRTQPPSRHLHCCTLLWASPLSPPSQNSFTHLVSNTAALVDLLEWELEPVKCWGTLSVGFTSHWAQQPKLILFDVSLPCASFLLLTPSLAHPAAATLVSLLLFPHTRRLPTWGPELALFFAWKASPQKPHVRHLPNLQSLLKHHLIIEAFLTPHSTGLLPPLPLYFPLCIALPTCWHAR